MAQTLDQKRAGFAWKTAQNGVNRFPKEYKPLVKGAPALIMNSGLMSTLAFYADKSEASKMLRDDITAWFNERFRDRREYQPNPTRFPDVMAKLHGGSSAFYVEATDEALEILKWIRQFVDAVE